MVLKSEVQALAAELDKRELELKKLIQSALDQVQPRVIGVLRVAGSFNGALGGTDWAPNDDLGKFEVDLDSDAAVLFLREVPPGQWMYKVTVDGSWETNYGEAGVQDGNNMEVSIADEAADVRFCFDLSSHVCVATVERDGKEIVYSRGTQEEVIRVVGTMNGQVGGKDWAADDDAGIMMPSEDGASMSLIFRDIPVGEWEYKITVDGSWTVNYGEGGDRDGDNMIVSVHDAPADVRFHYTTASHDCSAIVERDGVPVSDKERPPVWLVGGLAKVGRREKDEGVKEEEGEMRLTWNQTEKCYSVRVGVDGGRDGLDIDYRVKDGSVVFGLGGLQDGASAHCNLGPGVHDLQLRYDSDSHVCSWSTVGEASAAVHVVEDADVTGPPDWTRLTHIDSNTAGMGCVVICEFRGGAKTVLKMAPNPAAAMHFAVADMLLVKAGVRVPDMRVLEEGDEEWLLMRHHVISMARDTSIKNGRPATFAKLVRTMSRKPLALLMDFVPGHDCGNFKDCPELPEATRGTAFKDEDMMQTVGAILACDIVTNNWDRVPIGFQAWQKPSELYKWTGNPANLRLTPSSGEGFTMVALDNEVKTSYGNKQGTLESFLDDTEECLRHVLECEREGRIAVMIRSVVRPFFTKWIQADVTNDSLKALQTGVVRGVKALAQDWDAAEWSELLMDACERIRGSLDEADARLPAWEEGMAAVETGHMEGVLNIYARLSKADSHI